jgi:hypothetical protein
LDSIVRGIIGLAKDLRVERAQALFHGKGLNIDALAAEVGYLTERRCKRSCESAWGGAYAIFVPICADGLLMTY